ncbi:uncharacterized protein LOC5520679 isoform X2 [Nematostella vectensis]|uniref:uncharacterized protein LOC5520679 isoform X2 n=1 Tax=Nematostella vectensis TaxID=45351 RepID=UPI0013901E10|nr:uncharacterized protein LOC5520679 isoform X2 [Nematostella vectensis]
MAGSEVHLYVYELSNGLARQMSPLLLGKQIDGIWHTGVVCFGKEFFFGGGGIESCPPGGTILGSPDEVMNLGVTHVTEDLFMEYVHGLSCDAFRPEKYHLFEHNCNTFSNEIAMFLTGQKIPRHIQDLPKDVLNSAFGQMIKPLVDSMRVTPAGGTSFGGNERATPSAMHQSHRIASSGNSSKQQEKQNPESIFEPRESVPRQSQVPGAMELLPPPPAVFNVNEVETSFEELKSGLMSSGNSDMSSLEELKECVTKKPSTVTDKHVTYIDNLYQQLTQKQGQCLLLLMEILQVLCLNKHFLQLSQVNKFLRSVIKDFSSATAKETDTHTSAVKMLVTDEAPPHLSTVAVCSLLHEQEDVIAAGAALAFNIARYTVNEDIALECSTAIIEVLNKGTCGETAYRCLYALQRFMQCSSEIADLVTVMGVDLTKYQGQSRDIDELCKDLQALMS